MPPADMPSRATRPTGRGEGASVPACSASTSSRTARLFRRCPARVGRSGTAAMMPFAARNPPHPAMFRRLRGKPCATTAAGA